MSFFLAGADGGAEATVDAPKGSADHEGTADVSHVDAGNDATPDAASDEARADAAPHDAAPKLPPVACGDASCPVPAELCCVGGNLGPPVYRCNDVADAGLNKCMGIGTRTPVLCDEAEDCPGQVCCGTKNEAGTGYTIVECKPTCGSFVDDEIVFCNPDAKVSECMAPLTCNPSMLLPNYFVCSNTP